MSVGTVIGSKSVAKQLCQSVLAKVLLFCVLRITGFPVRLFLLVALLTMAPVTESHVCHFLRFQQLSSLKPLTKFWISWFELPRELDS